MRSRSVCHLSHARDGRDGGIATAVADLVLAQRQAGLQVQWRAADELAAVAELDPAGTVLHLHGLWRRPTRRIGRWQRAGFASVVAPHGMLDPWALAQSRRRKQLVWKLWERRALAEARCLQALCPAEAIAIHALLPAVPIALIPNGVRLPGPAADLPPPPWAGQIPAGAPVLLFLGRFHAKKGLDPLLTAWQSVASQARRAGWWLALVGYGDGGRLQRRLAAAPVPGVIVCGPVSGAAKQATLAGAAGFVLPSHSEGLPMAALEAMAHRLPALLSTACNLPEAFSCGAALPAEPDPQALQQALLRLFALSVAERGAMGASGQALMREQFSWEQVALQSEQLYRWLLGGGEQPACVEGKTR